MIWSNWQGAIGRSAIVVLLFWTGLAWTQTPAPRPVGEGPERIMVVHDNGKSTRCRVKESWQLPDARIAHLLEAVEGGELITIVDERSPASEPMSRNLKAMPKRIFTWGQGKRTPPEGAPLPPNLHVESSVVLHKETPPPAGFTRPDGPVIVNQRVDEKAIGADVRSQGSVLGFEKKSAPPIITNVAGTDSVRPIITNAQNLEFPNAAGFDSKVVPVPGKGPQIVNHEPTGVEAGLSKQGYPLTMPSGVRPPVFPRVNAIFNKVGPEGYPAPCDTPPTSGPFAKNPKAPGAGGPAIPHQMFPGTTPSLGQASPNIGQATQMPIDPNGGVRSTGLQQIDPSGTRPSVPPARPNPGAQSAPGDPNVRPGAAPTAPIASIPSAPVHPNVRPGVTPTSPLVGSQSVPLNPGLKPGVTPIAGVPTNPVAPIVGVPSTPINPNLKPGVTPIAGVPTNPVAPIVGVPSTPINPNIKPGVTPIAGVPSKPVAPIVGVPSTPINPNVKPGVGAPIAPIAGVPSTPVAPIAGIPSTPINPNIKPGVMPVAPIAGVSSTPVAPLVGVPSTPINPNLNPGLTPVAPVAGVPSTPPAPSAGVRPKPLDPGERPGTLPSYPFGSGRTFGSNSGRPTKSATKPASDDDKPLAHKPAESTTTKSWRPGDLLFGWMKKEAAPATPTVDPWKTDEPKKSQRTEDLLAKENAFAEKRIAERMDKLPKVPFSTALAQSSVPEAKKPEATPLVMPSVQKPRDEKIAIVPPLVPSDVRQVGDTAPALSDKPSMWGTGSKDAPPVVSKTALDPTTLKAEVVTLPPAPVARTNDPLAAPERYVPNDSRLKPKAMVLPAVASTPSPMVAPRELPAPATVPGPTQPAQQNNWPPGAQSVLAARSSLSGPVAFVPVPLMTTPQPNNPPAPPPPQMPEAPQLNAYVNAFSTPAAPRPQLPPQTAASMPAWMQPNPQAMMQQQMMQTQLMQQAMMQQQMIHQQQMMLAQGYRPSPNMNPYMPYGQPAPSQGPMSNMARHYAGPMPPSSYAPTPALASGYAPASYPPMMPMNSMMPPQQPSVQQTNYQAMPTQQPASGQQLDQLIKVLRESPYPAQREWAAQSLTSFEWRAYPQVVPALLSSASQDPAASVRAGCVNCLGRMGAAVEPVFGTLHSMRNDIDPRVRQEVEQAFIRLGQNPMPPH